MVLFLFIGRGLASCRAAMAQRLGMSMSISSEAVVTNGVVTPIPVAPFPSMEAVQPAGIANQPHIAGAQVVILIADNTDEFNSVPDIGVRNLDFDRGDLNGRRGNLNDRRRRRDHEDGGTEDNRAIGFNHTTGH